MTFKGENVVLLNGKLGPVRKETSIEFKTEFSSIFDISFCNEVFKKKWLNHLDDLRIISSDFDVNLILDYEITVYDSHFPCLYFSEKFINFLNEINCSLSFYFYQD